uniref:galactokinase n=1 Tax=Faecalibacterium prausnitzii TaxID=853 RepID=UPI003FEDE94D
MMKSIPVWKQELSDGVHAARLASLYCCAPAETASEAARYAAVLDGLEKTFGSHAEAGLYSAPGRTEIGGNHTDHQHGRVLAGSVNIDMIAAAAPNDKNQLRVQSEGYDLCVIDLNDLEARKEEENTTASLLRGECAAFTQRGAKLAGLDVYISSNVPKGSGVSSSAAFEVLIGVILNDCFMTEKVSPIAIAQIGQWAENVYFGKPCGLMDQMASSVGNIITIDFASPAKPVVEPVAVDFSKAGLALCILDSGADHADLTDEYAAIPAECRAVAAVCGGEVLRDVPFETFLAKLPECRRQCGDRAVLRAFHVYADNDRVAKQVAALHNGDFGTFLSLVNESGCSSWEYLQNVIPAGYKEHQEVGVTIAAAKHLLGDKGAVRVHGGGFAGTVQAFVPVEMLDEFKAGMEAILGEGRCHVLSIRPEGGAVL